MGGFIDVIFLKVSHLYPYFGVLGDQISYGRYLWVGKGGRCFSHDGWLAAITVFFSEILLQFLHCPGKTFVSSWPKVKNVAFRFTAPALEVSIIFGIGDWFVSIFLSSVLLGIGGLPLVPVSRYILFITLR